MNLETLQSEVSEWASRNFPHNKPHMPLLGAAEEIGELCHAHLKSEQGIRGTPSKHHAAKEDAVGDIIIYLANYCGLNNINMDLAVSTAWNQVKQRDWNKNPQTGN